MLSRGKSETEKSIRALLGSAVVLAVCFTFLFYHYDCEAITQWGYDLLECIRAGKSSIFPEYTYENFGSPTNYSLFVNLITALWLSPLYLIDQAAGLDISLFGYEIWYKVLLCAFLLADLAVFDRLLKKLGWEGNTRKEMLALFLLSGITLLATLGKGQIDVYGFLFAQIGAEALLEKKYVKMALMFGLALLVKPTALLLIVPLFLLLISRWGIQTLLYAALFVLPYGLNQLITMLWMPKYIPLSRKTFELLAKALGGLTIREQFFDLQINQILIFMAAGLVICFLCYYLGIHQQVRAEHFLALPPLLLICFGIFVCASYHWFFYLLPAFLLAGERFRKKSDFYLLLLGMNLGLVLYFSAAESMAVFSDTVIQYTGEWQEYLLSGGKTLFYVCMLLVIFVFFLEIRKNRGTEQKESRETEGIEDRTYQRLLLFLQPAPVILYLIVSLALTIAGN